MARRKDTALELHGDLLGDELGIQLGLADLDDVDLHLRTLAKVGDVLGHHFDLLALAADDEAGTGGVESHADAVPGALDDHTGQTGILKLVLEIAADREVLVQLVGVVFAAGIPLRAPVLIDGETECDRIYFLAHGR